jgi:2-amino-4-hydroxy-6-hydroxymethyldihydropteridine diphosphokinase
MDIDILFFGDRTVADEGLNIPHPRLHQRRFVLAPLAEIAPELLHPVLRQTITELLAALGDSQEVRPL